MPTAFTRPWVEGDLYGWWITSAHPDRHEPGQLYYYCNPHQGEDVPMTGWGPLRNGLGFERPAAAQADSYSFPRPPSGFTMLPAKALLSRNRDDARPSP